MQKKIAFLLVLSLMLSAVIAVSAETTSTAVSEIQKYGNLVLSLTGTEFLSQGYAYGDLVTVTINDQDLDMPVGSNYSDVDQGSMVCRVVIKPDLNEDNLILAINMGDLATASGIATKEKIEADPGYIWHYNVAEPVSVTFSLKEKSGYYDQWVLHQLVRSENREDYPELSDEAYANFRAISTTGIAAGKLYRSSSPVNPEIHRNLQADAASAAEGIKTFINLGDAEETMKAYEGFANSYYSKQDFICLNLGVDFSAPDFQEGLAQGLRFIASHEAPYLVHCNEGKDRAGFACAVIEALMGATAEEITADYMVTFYNYYHVEEGTEQYDIIASHNIQKSLATAFGLESIFGEDLQAAAVRYLESIGMSAEEITALQAALTD